MAGSSKHFFIGAGVSLGIYGLYKRYKNERWALEGILASAGLGAIMALLPDILEPATHPNHRGTFHSLIALIALILSSHKILQDEDLSDNEKLAFLLASSGYGSHLLADSQTSMGMPIC